MTQSIGNIVTMLAVATLDAPGTISSRALPASCFVGAEVFQNLRGKLEILVGGPYAIFNSTTVEV